MTLLSRSTTLEAGIRIFNDESCCEISFADDVLLVVVVSPAEEDWEVLAVRKAVAAAAEDADALD